MLESTYGDRLHEDRRTRKMRLKAIVEQALADNGTVLIPAFSIGRTQELLYELEDIIHHANLSQQLKTRYRQRNATANICTPRGGTAYRDSLEQLTGQEVS